MGLTILNDAQIERILENLTPDELDGFSNAIATTLEEHSRGRRLPEGESYEQPHRTTTLNHETGATSLYMPSCNPRGMGCKVVTLSTSDSKKPPIQPTGAITLISPIGKPIGFIHARTLTAFRTALASTCLVTKRGSINTITSFGSGLQSYWHVRLALMTRGSTIKHVNIAARSLSDKAYGIINQFNSVPAAIKAREGWSDTDFNLLTPEDPEYERLIKESLRESDVIFCCVPSKQDLFDADILTGEEGQGKGRLVVAVGSYRPDMRELPEKLLLQAVKPGGSTGRIVVDTMDGVMVEAGELIDAKLEPKQMVELGELVGPDAAQDATRDEWLKNGTVIYKSVGIGLMDLATGTHIVKVATEKGVGTHVEDF